MGRRRLMRMPAAARRQRGVSLVEALVAFLVVGLGMLSIVSVQATLRYNSDVAKQRTEAVRLAQEELESLRAFTRLESTAGQPDYVEIASMLPRAVDVAITNTTYSIQREVTSVVNGGHKIVRVVVRWRDRRANPDVAGTNQEVALQSTIAALDPALGAVVTIPPASTSTLLPKARHPFIPTRARDLGDGRSVFKPAEGGAVAWVFDNTTGYITRCTVSFASTTQTLTSAQLVDCDDFEGFLLAGFVRFTAADPVTEADAEAPDGVAFNIKLVATPVGDGEREPRCFDYSEAAVAAASSSVTFFCVVYPRADNLWTGDLTAETDADGFAWGVGEGQYRLCRYSADYDADGTVENAEHPARYTNMDGGLLNQNFLVVPGPASCPTDSAPDPSSGDLINANTVQVEPAAG